MGAGETQAAAAAQPQPQLAAAAADIPMPYLINCDHSPILIWRAKWAALIFL
jgi:hypothetical protein